MTPGTRHSVAPIHDAPPPGAIVAAAPSDVFPLDRIYEQHGLAFPSIEIVPGDCIPEPQRRLLVHQNDMTPTLEEYYGCDIHLEVLRSEVRGDDYVREVVLRLNGSNLPVEFGANRIDLSLYHGELRRLVLEEHVPLGHLLKEFAIPHTSRPRAYLRVQPDPWMQQAFGLEHPTVLYGRRNTLRDPQGRPLSQIVEILPPPLPQAQGSSRNTSTPTPPQAD